MPSGRRGAGVRVVRDTNVVVSALIWDGRPERLLDLAVSGEIALFSSAVMRDRSANESPMSVGTATVRAQGRRTPPSVCLADTLQALAELDDEIVEDGLPEIKPSVRKEAERIIVRLARHPWAPTVYPTRDAEIAIHFKSPDSPGSAVVRLDNHGRAECYAYTHGHSRRARYDASSNLPDGFVTEQLATLMPTRVVSPRDRRLSGGLKGPS